MSFDGTDDIAKMFAEAAGAAEETNEGDPSLVGAETNEQKYEPKIEPKPEPKPEPVKEKVVKEPKVAKEPVMRESTKRREPLINQNNKSRRAVTTNIDGISVSVIERIIQMKDILSEYDETQRSFVMGYFQVETDSSAEAIYSSLTASSRELKALEMIVTARGYSPADRAFYLVGLDNGDIEAIYEQVELLAGEINDGVGRRVNHDNKLEVCKLLERTIAEMEGRVFDYINKLQAFTNLAN